MITEMMDSRQPYKAAAQLSKVVSWDKEWIHFGTADQIKFNVIQNLIATFLNDDQIVLVHSRKGFRTQRYSRNYECY